MMVGAMAVGMIFVCVLGYLLGSIPTGYLMARMRGVDIRSVGSGNIGATNAMRVLGKGPGITVLLVDALKGYLACATLPAVAAAVGFGPGAGDADPGATAEWLRMAGGFSAILGHNYTCWLGFKGGKGIATSAGVLLGLVPLPLLIVVVVFLITVALSRYVSLGSIVCALTLPFATAFTGGSLRVVVLTVVMSVLALWKHRANMGRLMAGTESRLGSGPRPPAAPGGAA